MLSEHGCQIAPRTFYAWATRPPSARALWDTAITEVLAGFYEPDQDGRRQPESLYGAVKMWAPDLVDRQFTVSAPNRLLVADFTYVRLACGVFVYTAFAIDAYAGRIVGWTCSAGKSDAFVRRAIRHAAELRCREGKPLSGSTIHHSDAGSQGGFNRSSQHRPVRAIVDAR